MIRILFDDLFHNLVLISTIISRNLGVFSCWLLLLLWIHLSPIGTSSLLTCCIGGCFNFIFFLFFLLVRLFFLGLLRLKFGFLYALLLGVYHAWHFRIRFFSHSLFIFLFCCFFCGGISFSIWSLFFILRLFLLLSYCSLFRLFISRLLDFRSCLCFFGCSGVFFNHLLSSFFGCFRSLSSLIGFLVILFMSFLMLELMTFHLDCLNFLN